VHYAFDNRIFHKECRSLASAGYDVTLIAPHAGGDLVRGGVRLHAIKLSRGRVARFTITMARLLLAAAQENASVYHYHDPELMPAGWLLKLFGKKVIYDVHEDYAGSMEDKQWIPAWLRKPAAVSVRACEAIFGSTCDRVVAATPAIAEMFSSRNVSLVQNFPWSSELLGKDSDPYECRQPIAVYVGVLSDFRGLREMIAAVVQVSHKMPVQLLTAGEVKAGEKASGMDCETNGAVTHLGSLNRPEVADLLGRARIGLVVLHPIKNYVVSQPTKLYEYMSAGIPVIASDFPVWRQIVQSSGCGLLVNPLDPLAIANAIEWLLRHPAEAEAMGRNGQRAVADRYNWEREAKSLLAVYKVLAPTAAHGSGKVVAGEASKS
jgi:glycosyltransferase involved in cell wall biosynthesis